MAYKITDACIKCGACAANCPVECISEGEEKYIIDPERCIECGTCAAVCPVGAPKLEDQKKNVIKISQKSEKILTFEKKWGRIINAYGGFSVVG